LRRPAAHRVAAWTSRIASPPGPRAARRRLDLAPRIAAPAAPRRAPPRPAAPQIWRSNSPIRFASDFPRYSRKI